MNETSVQQNCNFFLNDPIQPEKPFKLEVDSDNSFEVIIGVEVIDADQKETIKAPTKVVQSKKATRFVEDLMMLHKLKF